MDVTAREATTSKLSWYKRCKSGFTKHRNLLLVFIMENVYKVDGRFLQVLREERSASPRREHLLRLGLTGTLQQSTWDGG
jgi:hypothetical protein